MPKHAGKPPREQKPTRVSRWEVLAFKQPNGVAPGQVKPSDPSLRDRAAGIALDIACGTVDAAKARIDEIRSLAQSSEGMRLALIRTFKEIAEMCDGQDMKAFLLETADQLKKRTL